jgi:murein DD-endopeptidase MepM/ murein hydrolase activator NlpD
MGRSMMRPGLIALAMAGLGLAACEPETPAASSSSAASAIPPDSATSGTVPDSSSSSAAPPASSAEPPASSSAAPPASSAAPPPPTPGFSFDPPGQLERSGHGVTDATIWIPGMRFPMLGPPAYANSQVYGHGGGGNGGPPGPGGQCDTANYTMPWHDNFCESRGYATPLCPSGKGHQGQDIRPNSCHAAQTVAVAAEPGTVTGISTYIVYITTDSGRRYDYLHLQMNQLKVHLGDHVTRGQQIGLVSNNFGGTPTTIHLHLEIKQAVTHNGASIVTFIPLYSSLVNAYQRMLAGTP